MDYIAFYIEKFVTKFLSFYADGWESILLGLIQVFIVFVILMIAECYAIGYKKSTLSRLVRFDSGVMVDLSLFLLTHTSLIAFIAIIMSFALPFFVAESIRNVFSTSYISELPTVLHFIIFFVVLDFFHYWQHRFLHECPGFWAIHKLHHSATEMNFITVTREHPLDKAVNVLFFTFTAIITGVPEEHYVSFAILSSAYGMIKHSSFIDGWGFFGKYIVQSPRDHWIHHSPYVEHYDTNYGNNLAIWDHLFGTYYKGDKLNDRIGLPTAELDGKNVFYLVWHCYVVFLRDIFKLVTHPKKFLKEFNRTED